MRVELKSLKDNPFRNFKVDPIDPAVVEALKESIQESPGTFWGGIVARKTKHDGIQLAFGHHRIRAAIAAGIREDDIKVVSNITDAEMIRMYALENATQRGNSGTAITGTVASAVRFLLKGALVGELSEIRQLVDGIGWSTVLEFLDGVPGVNRNVINQQLANIKASGDYALIVREVQQEIEEERKEELKALEAAEREQRKREEAAREAEAYRAAAEERRKEAAKAAKAAKEEADKRRAEAEAKRAELAQQKAEAEARLAEKRRKEAAEQMKQFDALRTVRANASAAANKAEEREVTFDLGGVSKYLKTPSHIDTFREIVTGQGLKPYLPVNRQADLAKHLAEQAEHAGPDKMTSSFLRNHTYDMATRIKGAERRLDAEDKAELFRKDWAAKAASYQAEFARNARGMLAAAIELAEHNRKRPKGVTLHMTNEFSQAVKKAEDALSQMRKAGVI